MLDKMTRVNNKRMTRIIASDKGTMAQNYDGVSSVQVQDRGVYCWVMTFS